jgi:hypothetical protein
MTEAEMAVAEIEFKKTEQEKAVALLEQVLRLEGNPDFQSLIMEDFIKNETLRLMASSVNGRMSAENRALSKEMAVAGPQLYNFLTMIKQLGMDAQDKLAMTEIELIEARLEASREA